MRIIPAIDIMGGKCVRLSQGDFSTKKVYSEDPLEVARQFEDHGIRYLHLVDLDGARNRKVENLRVLEKIATATNLEIDFGGGLRTLEEVMTVINAGAAQVTAGSIAVTDPDEFMNWLTKLGSEKLILGADCIEKKVATSGWLETSPQDVVSFIAGYAGKGIRYTVCTDISKDGMLAGPSLSLYKEILAAVGVSLIASGGITTQGHLEELHEIGCEGAIIGKAIYEGKLTLKMISKLC